MIIYDPQNPEPFIRKAFAGVMPDAVRDRYVEVARPPIQRKPQIGALAIISVALLMFSLFIPGFIWGAMFSLGFVIVLGRRVCLTFKRQHEEHLLLSDLVTVHPDLVHMVVEENQKARDELFAQEAQEAINRFRREDQAAARGRLHEREI